MLSIKNKTTSDRKLHGFNGIFSADKLFGPELSYLLLYSECSITCTLYYIDFES
jgi:hypothetical protein